ncbi:MAG: diaminopimelate epimerase, partial [Actinomycetota bacterium]|nr:diaminopimelate epimerase [Actinomycetota bacterium]
MTDAVHLSKHHGLGNDFLVLVDVDRNTTVDAATARRLCDRRLGVGADGLIRVVPATSAAATGDAGADRADGADVAMELRNADGSVAEMSGNGIRCLAQAVARHRGVDTLDLAVAT